MSRKCALGPNGEAVPGADPIGGCGHLLNDFHDEGGCHAAAATSRNNRYYDLSGFQRVEPPAGFRVTRCPCRRKHPLGATRSDKMHLDEPADAAFLDD